MGNKSLNPLLFASTHSQQEIPWSQDFHLLDKQPLNSTYILHHLPTTTSYKVKHLTLNKLQNSELFRQIDLRSVNPSPFVVQVEKVQQYTVKGYCSQNEEVFVMFKHVENTLKQEILNRRFKKQKFTEQQIKVLLESGVKGISYLNDIGCTPKALNTSQVLITPSRAVLINDPLLSVGSILSDTKQRTLSGEHGPKNPIFSIPQEDYPSPEKLLYQNDLIEEYNEWLSELFTFGMIVLETIFLEPLIDVLYDRGQKKIYYHKVKEKIQEITEGVQMGKQHNVESQFKFSYQEYNSVSMVSSNILNEIKEDLRRLLSHQPRIRESVQLKYKKTHSNSLYLNRTNNYLQQNNAVYGNLQASIKDKYQQNSFKFSDNLGLNFKVDKEIQSFKKYSQTNEQTIIMTEGHKNYEEGQQQFNKNNQANKFRVVSSSMPSKQPINSKNPFVMPVTSEYLIGNIATVENEKKVLHYLGKKGETLKNKQQELGGLVIGKTGFEFGNKSFENKYGNTKDSLFQYPTSNINFESLKIPSQNHYTFPITSPASNPTTWTTSQNFKLNSSTYTPNQYIPQFNFNLSSSIQKTSNINLSTTNVTRSSTSYVIPTTGSGGSSGFDYEKYLTNKVNQKDRMNTVWNSAAQTENSSQLSSCKFTPYSENFRQYLTLAGPLPENNKLSSQGTFINFEQWKKIQASSTQPFLQNSKFPLSKQLSHFPFKQVGSINCDDSHFLADKESFVIQSYSTGVGKLPVPRVETPISTLHSSNMPNLSPKNSFEINYSHISNFRNQGKSFGSVDEDLKQLRNFGIHREIIDKKPYSSYSSSQKVSVIDKIYDPQIQNSHDLKSLQTTDNKVPQAINRKSQSLLQSSKQKPRNSSQPYLQTPERYPTKYKLNSTIREASCEESGVNHSGDNNQEEERAYPNTEVTKYYGLEDRRLSQRKVDTGGYNCVGQNAYKYEVNCTYAIDNVRGGNQPKACQRQPFAQKQQLNNSHRVILYADGSRYIGQTDHQGQSHGDGILYYSDGQVAYDGQWLHGDFNGHGKLSNPYPVNTNATYDFKDLTGIDQHLKEYEGEFRKDEKEGKGVFKMQNGEVFQGEFWQDIVHGRGKFYCKDGTVFEGVWERGKLKSLVGNQVQE